MGGLRLGEGLYLLVATLLGEGLSQKFIEWYGRTS